MARRVQREMTLEEFDAWSKSNKRVDAVADAADEVGGPRLSLVPLPEQNEAWPTDLLPPNPPQLVWGRGTGRRLVEGPTPTPPSRQCRSTASLWNPRASASPDGARSAKGCS